MANGISTTGQVQRKVRKETVKSTQADMIIFWGGISPMEGVHSPLSPPPIFGPVTKNCTRFSSVSLFHTWHII